VFSDYILQRGAAICELFADLGCTLQSEQRVRERVVANNVPCLNDFADNVWALVRKASD
jgi:hypothetical protein